jgi:AcrR family transcriptional regulator
VNTKKAAETGEKVDGRHLRVERGKAAVMKAIVSLFAEGKHSPSIAEAAQRAGVSERSLFRYFSSTDDLIAETVAYFYPQVEHYFTAQPPVAPLDVRLFELAVLRLDFCANHSTVAATVEILAHKSPAAAAARYGRALILTDQLKNWLGDTVTTLPEEKLCLLAVLYDFPTMMNMHKLVGSKAAKVMADAAMAIINDK